MAERVPVAGLGLTGGDTAVHVARRLGATGLLVCDELEQGVVVTQGPGAETFAEVTVQVDARGHRDCASWYPATT